MSPKEIIRQLEAKIKTLEDSLRGVSDPEIVARDAVQELGGYPKAGVKVVDINYRPEHRKSEFEYRPGNTLTADDWDNDAHCGHGLHYSGSIVESNMYTHAQNTRAVIVVATGAHVEIDSSKSKAETLYVDREIDIRAWEVGEATRREIYKMRDAISAYNEAKADLKSL